MGILDKIMFWKKKDEFSDIGLGDKENLAFGDEFGNRQLGLDQGFGQQAPGQQGSAPPTQPPLPTEPTFQSSSQFQQPVQPPRYEPQQDMNSKNLEVISSKLDALRASIDSLNQRLANLEAIARGEEERSRRRYY